MAPLFLKKLFYTYQEKQGHVQKARAKIADLVGADDVLEIGCGFGANSEYCQGSYLGVDIRADVIREARKNHPAKKFMYRDHQEIANLPVKNKTLLFCAVLHEIPDYCSIIQQFILNQTSRIFICDFNPALRGWLKLWMDVFEPDAKNWWNNGPLSCFQETDWTITSGEISKSLFYWDAQKRIK